MKSNKTKFDYKIFFIVPIKIYQKIISPLFPNSCRFYPSCSEYFILAIEKYGIIIGTIKGSYRILRCNPFSQGGIDFP